jgi:hypothetical protein
MTTTLTPRHQSIPLLDKYHHYPNITPSHDNLAAAKTEPRAADKTSGQQEHDTMSKSNEAQGEPQPQAELLKRVLSSGSNTSKGSQTPTKSTIPLSPASPGGARTPRARKTALQTDDAHAKQAKTETALASDMDGLQVKSPVLADMTNTPNTLADVLATGQPGNGTNGQIAHDRSNSSSTENSESFHPPSLIGGSYGPEGFPLSTNVAEDGHQMTSSELQMSAQAAAAIAAADEAIKQLNGTSSVIQGPPGVPSVDSPYALPRGYANFVKPQARSEHRSPEFNVHRQSSTSSSMTEASTSSEESDLCVPGIEWVNVVSPAPETNFGRGSPFSPSLGGAAKSMKSPGRMAPPAGGRGLASPRRNPADRPGLPTNASLPLGSTAKSPSGLEPASALPSDIDPNAPSTDDDDEQTVGQGRDRSSSSSSQSTGLDLLWAATQNPGTESGGPNTDSPYDQAFDSKGKRKAGAEAVAQWRASGTLGGSSDAAAPANAAKPEAAKNGTGPPKKRRRSEIQMEAIDPALRDEGSPYVDDSAMGMEVDKMSNSGSDSGESLDSLEDPEYKGETTGRGRTTGVRSRAAGAGGKKGGKAGGRASTGTAGANGLTSKAGGGKKARKTDSPNRGGGGGGGAGGGSKKTAGSSHPTANVQCEYVNPLPVSLISQESRRCADRCSPTTGARMCLRESTICRDIWPDTLDARESSSTRASCPRTRRYCGRQSRTSPRLLAMSAERASLGEFGMALDSSPS